MCKKLNWMKNWNVNYLKVSSKLIVILIGIILFALPTYAQVDKLIIKNRDSIGNPNPYMKVGGAGIWPCSERFAISVEDTTRFIFSAASAFCATLMPNKVDIDYPGDGYGDNGKRNIDDAMSYQKAFERIRNLKPGYQESAMGEKWTLAAEQIEELYPDQVYEVDYKDKARISFNYNNVLFELLMSIQLLANQNDEKQSIIEQQATAIEMLNERLEQIENSLNIDTEIIPHKTLGEVTISPNPITNGNIQVTYQLNENGENAVLKITDIQGKQVYEVPIKANQKRSNQNLEIDLPAGSYLYYLENNAEQTLAKKLIIL